MEIRVIQESDMPNVAGLSRYVFDTCLRNRMEFEQTIGFVEDYLQVEHLLEMIREERVVLWGAFEGEQLVGVSGLQSDGMITMLYVLPQYANRGYGSALLGVMREYAKDVYDLPQVVVNATPAWTSSYFAKQGFAYDHHNMHVPFITMRAKSGANPMFEKKHVPVKVMIGAAVGCLIFATVACIAYLIWYT